MSLSLPKALLRIDSVLIDGGISLFIDGTPQSLRALGEYLIKHSEGNGNGITLCNDLNFVSKTEGQIHPSSNVEKAHLHCHAESTDGNEEWFASIVR